MAVGNLGQTSQNTLQNRLNMKQRVGTQYLMLEAV